MADLNKLDLVGPLQRSDDAVDAIAGIPVNASNAPSVQLFYKEVTGFHLTTPDKREAMRFCRSGLAA
jgi:hypothetical protein